MSSPDEGKTEWLIGILQKEMETFHDVAGSLSTRQNKAFWKQCELLQEDSDSLKRRSTSGRHARRQARTFLTDLFRLMGPDGFLLCSVTVSATELNQMAYRIDRSRLREWWENARHPPGLVAAAKKICDSATIESLGLPRPTEPEGRGTTDADDTHLASENASLGETANIFDGNRTRDFALEHASLGETANIFDGYRTREFALEHASLGETANIFDGKDICDAIQRVVVDSNPKAVIKMAFLPSGRSECLVSLYIREEYVQKLAQSLFDARVQWMQDGLHVVSDQRVTVVVPGPEATLKGVSQEAVANIFGAEIQKGISECPIRRTETEDGKDATECVSMTITKKDAVIDLSLGFATARRIWNKLYCPPQ